MAITTVTETYILETNESATGLYAASGVIKHKNDSMTRTLTPTSTPPAATHAANNVPLVAGAATIDLTALTDWGLNEADPNATGLKLQILAIKAKATNTAGITITPGASNAYNALGSAFSVTLMAGQEIKFYGNDATPDVASDAKTLDLAGTGTDSLDIEMIFG